jgi:hypothetical protein
MHALSAFLCQDVDYPCLLLPTCSWCTYCLGTASGVCARSSIGLLCSACSTSALLTTCWTETDVPPVDPVCSQMRMQVTSATTKQGFKPFSAIHSFSQQSQAVSFGQRNTGGAAPPAFQGSRLGPQQPAARPTSSHGRNPGLGNGQSFTAPRAPPAAAQVPVNSPQYLPYSQQSQLDTLDLPLSAPQDSLPLAGAAGGTGAGAAAYLQTQAADMGAGQLHIVPHSGRGHQSSSFQQQGSQGALHDLLSGVQSALRPGTSDSQRMLAQGGAGAAPAQRQTSLQPPVQQQGGLGNRQAAPFRSGATLGQALATEVETRKTNDNLKTLQVRTGFQL